MVPSKLRNVSLSNFSRRERWAPWLAAPRESQSPTQLCGLLTGEYPSRSRFSAIDAFLEGIISLALYSAFALISSFRAIRIQLLVALRPNDEVVRKIPRHPLVEVKKLIDSRSGPKSRGNAAAWKAIMAFHAPTPLGNPCGGAPIPRLRRRLSCI